MLDLNSLVAGRIYSFRHIKVITDWRKDTPEWLVSCEIKREAVFAGNAANRESYTKQQTRKNPDYQSSGKSWFTWTGQAGIIQHKTKGLSYLAVLNPRKIKSTYFVGGIEATSEQVKEISQWRKSNGEFSDFAVFSLDSVVCMGEAQSIPVGWTEAGGPTDCTIVTKS